MIRVTVLLLSLAMPLSGCGDDGEGGGRDGNLFLSDRVLNIAHRGGRDLRPEHTLLAYQHALDVGADVLELDLHSTADGVIVAMHDDTVDRTTDGSGAVHSLTVGEIKQLDAGFRFTRDGGATYPYRGQGIEVPTFEEIVATFPDSYLVIEIKQASPSIVVPVLDIIHAAGIAERVVIGAFSDAVNAEIREIDPTIMTNLSMGEVIQFLLLDEESEATYVPPGRFHQVPPTFGGTQVITPDYVARVDRFGGKIHAWTINDPEEMRMLIDLGVDGIITDDPVALEAVLAEG